MTEQAIRAADAAVKADGAAFPMDPAAVEFRFYKDTGRMMPEDGWDTLTKHDAILFGAIGRPDVPDHIRSTVYCCRCGGSSTST